MDSNILVFNNYDQGFLIRFLQVPDQILERLNNKTSALQNSAGLKPLSTWKAGSFEAFLIFSCEVVRNEILHIRIETGSSFGLADSLRLCSRCLP